MRYGDRILALAGALALLSACSRSGGPAEVGAGAPRVPVAYPPSRTADVVDTYHGIEVRDPYRWLEEIDSAATRAWIEAQNKVASRYLESIAARPTIRRRLVALWNYEKFGIPLRKGNRYFFSRKDGLQNQSVLYTISSLDGEPQVLLDPNRLSSDGTVALTRYAPSDDGRLLAYGLSRAGSDWQEWRIRDVETCKDLPDVLRWIKFSGASWTRDGKGFYYSRYDEPREGEGRSEVNYNQKLYYHAAGTRQADDILVYSRPDHKEWSFDGEVTEDGRYLIITVGKGTDPRTRVTYRGLGREDAPFVDLLKDFDASYEFIGNDGPVFWFRTDLDAPRGRVIAVDTTRPLREDWTETLPESRDTLAGVSLIHGLFLARYLKDARSEVKIFRRDGSLERELPLPGPGTAAGFRGRRADTETFFSFASFTRPREIYRLDLLEGKTTLFRRPRIDVDPDDYVTRQVFYESKDGTRIPMFISHKKGLRCNGRNAAILYGYGGFNISITPRFSVPSIVWMEMGGVYAVPNLRGGGEYGREWHEAGCRLKKQNVFDDFIAAARWLIEHEYTSAPKLAIQGRSNGGLLVGACLTQRPDLFGAALPAVGVLDMLRFDKFTIGWAWTSDYGSPANPEEFRALLAYSPLHHIRAGTRYPATLITTADHDDRVVPAHSFKFAAALQAAQASPAPVLIRIETKAGHGAGKPTAKRIDEAADRLAFLFEVLGLSPGLVK